MPPLHYVIFESSLNRYLITYTDDAQEETVVTAGEENMTRVVEVTQAEMGVGVMDYLERALRKVF